MAVLAVTVIPPPNRLPTTNGALAGIVVTIVLFAFCVLSSSLGRFMGGVPGITPKCDDSVLGAFFAAVESMPRRRMIILFGVGCTPAVSDVVAGLLPAAPARIMFPIGRLAFTVAVVIGVVGVPAGLSVVVPGAAAAALLMRIC